MGDKDIQHNNVNEEEEESTIHRDILEGIMSKVSLIDLVSASSVSKSWGGAVSTSLSHLNKPKPWLLIYTQSTSSFTKNKTHAYDPRSDIWIEIKQMLNPSEIPTLRSSSSSNLVYELSNKGLAFSSDPLHQTWYQISPPKIGRVDPIVALVGHHVIVAGEGSYFEDAPLSVEMYDMETSQWSMCQSIPYVFKESTTNTWLSIASNKQNLYITIKASGITCSFDPETKTWSGPYNLSPEPRVFFSAIEFAGDDLILAGLVGHPENIDSLKLWKVKPELAEFNQISETPCELLQILKGESWDISSISLIATNNFIYIYNNSDPSIIIFCEYNQGDWKWGNVKNIVFDETRINHKMLITCADVGISDLRTAINSRNCKFLVKPSHY